MTAQPIRHPVRILGIDPGLRRTGWGVIEIDGNRLVFVGCGSVEPSDGLPLASRLLAIHEGLAAVLGDFKPAEAAVEQTFVNKDGVATLKLGQARGIAMLAPAMFGIPVAEYAPNQVKKTVVGAGHAEKAQIAMMLKILLPKASPPSADAADALAIAITHAHHRQSTARRPCCRSKPMSARIRSSCSASAPTRSANGFACSRPCRASARKSRSPCSARLRRLISPMRSRCATRRRCRARRA